MNVSDVLVPGILQHVLGICADRILVLKGLEENLELINLTGFYVINELDHILNLGGQTSLAQLHNFGDLCLVHGNILSL